MRDIAREHGALTSLIAKATDPGPLLGHLVELAVELCHAGSAGVSLLEPAEVPGMGVFRWVAMAGTYREYTGGTTPETFSPCGVCLAKGAPQLYRHPARLFTDLASATPPIVEGLVIPLRTTEGPAGTIWIVSHDDQVRFTARDVAIMTTLADFTAAALVLQRARERAEAANRAKDAFLAVVSHELRRPAAAITAWAELLLSGLASPVDAADAIEAIHANAHRQQDMIEDLIDASRAALGSLRLREDVIDLAAVVRSAAEVADVMAVAAGVRFQCRTGRSVQYRGDSERLRQVIGNLLDNALKHTPPGGEVSLCLEVGFPWVEIVVQDTGLGFSSHQATQIFEAFCHDDQSTPRGGSLGLGLSIARRLVTMHGGTLHGHSDGADRGSRFVVRLPSDRLSSPSPTTPPPVHVEHVRLSPVEARNTH